MSKFPPTPEQQAIIDCQFNRTDIIKVMAFAGTGKTTTLDFFARNLPKLRMLYIAFNKSVQIEASHRFPKNVDCRTSHSLAWSKFGKKFQDSGKLTNGSLRIKTIAEAFGWDKEKKYDLAKFTLSTVMKFIGSADNEIGKQHVPPEARRVMARQAAEKAGVEFDSVNFDDTKAHESDKELLSHAKLLWNRMCDFRDSEIQMIHDGYLKLWQMSNPTLQYWDDNLRRYLPYDVVLLDEAQDINPATADVFMKQKCVRVLVGDTHQQIYSFRGADNILAKIKAEHQFYLTQSFRFGEKIGRIGSLILNTFKKEARNVVGRNGIGELRPVDTNKKYTIITRTNSNLFKMAVDLYEEKRLGFVGGVEGYKFDDILDTYFLWADKREQIKDAYIRSFTTFKEMEKFAEEVDDLELKSRIKVVNEFHNRIPDLIRDITTQAVDIAVADVVFTTGHKAKGLEFEQVQLGNDFPLLVKENSENGKKRLVKDLADDEYNLIYVACTRAITRLDLCGSIIELLDFLKKSDILDKGE